VAIDYKRVVEAAVNAAFNENHADSTERAERKGGSGMKTVVAGAALVATARFAAKRVHLPNLGELSDRAGDFADRARDRLGLLDDDDYEDDYEDEEYEEPEDEADLDEDEDDDAEEDEEPDEEPEDEAELDEDEELDEQEDDEDEDLPPDERIDPASRPPRPPKRQKSKA
jgi:hypothetical protein